MKIKNDDKIIILNKIKLLNAFSQKHSELETELITLLRNHGLCGGVENDNVGDLPDWLVEIIDYGMNLEPINLEMVDKLIEELDG